MVQNLLNDRRGWRCRTAWESWWQSTINLLLPRKTDGWNLKMPVWKRRNIYKTPFLGGSMLIFGGAISIISVAWCCWWLKSGEPSEMYQNPVNNGIRYQPERVIAGFLNHQQYESWVCLKIRWCFLLNPRASLLNWPFARVFLRVVPNFECDSWE